MAYRPNTAALNDAYTEYLHANPFRGKTRKTVGERDKTPRADRAAQFDEYAAMQQPVERPAHE